VERIKKEFHLFRIISPILKDIILKESGSGTLEKIRLFNKYIERR